MDLNEFKNNLDKNGGPRSYMLFETFVLKLLEGYFRKKSKPFFPYYLYKTEDGKRIETDAYAPEGIDELLGPVIVEIKYSASPGSIKNISNYFHAILHRFHKFYKNKDGNRLSIENLFLIFGDKLSNEFKENAKYSLEKDNIKIKLRAATPP